jgi:hypothetical protein
MRGWRPGSNAGIIGGGVTLGSDLHAMTTHLWIYSVAGLVVGIITLALFRRPNSMSYLEKADAIREARSVCA